MIVYRICKTYPPDHNPIDGAGASKYPGRWNSKGTRMVYTASSLSLVRSEMARHINLEDLPDNLRVYEIKIPDQEFKVIKILPGDWSSDPEADSTKAIGDKYFSDKSVPGLKVPSVCDPESFYYLLNPLSEAHHLVKVVKDYPFVV